MVRGEMQYDRSSKIRQPRPPADSDRAAQPTRSQVSSLKKNTTRLRRKTGGGRRLQACYLLAVLDCWCTRFQTATSRAIRCVCVFPHSVLVYCACRVVAVSYSCDVQVCSEATLPFSPQRYVWHHGQQFRIW